MGRHTIKLSTSVQYLSCHIKTAIYFWQANCIPRRAVAFYYTSCGVPAALTTQDSFAPELVDAQQHPVISNQPRKPVSSEHSAGSSLQLGPIQSRKVPAWHKEPLVHCGWKTLWARHMKNAEVLPFFVHPAASSLTSPMLAHILWQAIQARGSDLVEIPAWEKSDGFLTRLTILNYSSQKLWKGAGGKCMARPELAPEVALSWSRWSSQS